MRCKVKLFVMGKVFYEEVYARNFNEAKEVAAARNPNAKIMNVTAVL
jgi:hypothetical protein